MTTTAKAFDPQEDVPAWAQRYGDCVALAKSDLSFRTALWTAKTEEIKNRLRGEAERVMNYRLHRR